MRLDGFFSRLYLAVGSLLLVGYLALEVRGVVFGGTDSKYDGSFGASSSEGRPSGGSGWFTGGHTGGK